MPNFQLKRLFLFTSLFYLVVKSLDLQKKKRNMEDTIKENGLGCYLWTSKETPHGMLLLLEARTPENLVAIVRVVTFGNVLEIEGLDVNGNSFAGELDIAPLGSVPSPDSIIKFIFRQAKELLTGDSTE